jgi:hypothetical protein
LKQHTTSMHEDPMFDPILLSHQADLIFFDIELVCSDAV